MNTDDFSYELPEQLIATRPPRVRGNARLLALDKDTGAIDNLSYSDLAKQLSAGDLVILNNTRVIRARLTAKDSSGKEREFLLLERHQHSLDIHRWKVLYRRKLHVGEQYMIGSSTIEVEQIYDGGIATITSDDDLLKISEKYGSVPLPPYMRRDATPEDIKRYQTEFAQVAGSVAAPTASLNFTNNLKAQLKTQGVRIEYLTLHVGLGTFLPIRTSNIENHVMHSEYYEIPEETVERIKETQESGGRIVAIGTTVTRTLEYAAEDILHSKDGSLSGEADIFIYPGYDFKLVDAMVTNFHAPRTTVLMLTAAFAGWPHLKAAYEAAANSKYHFLSYGDSMFIYSKNKKQLHRP